MKILIHSENPIVTSKIRYSLSTVNTAIESTDSFEACLKKLKKENIQIFFCCISSNAQEEMTHLDIIKNGVATYLIPIVAITLNDDAHLISRLHEIGITNVVSFPFFPEELRNLYDKILEKEGAYKNSYTTKFINATVELFGTRSTVYSLESKAMYVCNKLNIDSIEKSEILKALKYLSITQNHSLEKSITYFKNMGMAETMQNIFDQDPKSSIKSAIVYGVLKKDLEKIGRGGEIKQEIESRVWSIVEKAFSKEYYLLRDARDLQIFWEYLDDMLAAMDLPQSSKDLIIDNVRKFSRHTLFFHLGGAAKIYKQQEKTEIIIKPANKRLCNLCVERSGVSLDSNEFVKYTIVNDKDNSDLIIEITKIKSESAKATPEQQETPVKKDVISAQELFEANKINPADIEALEELESAMFDILYEIEFKEISPVYILKLGDCLYKYGNTLIYYPVFSFIADTLYGFAQSIKTNSMDTFDKSKVSSIVLIIESIITNLKIWRITIFVDRGADDINYLDRSIAADCDQFLYFLQKRDDDSNSDDTGDIELF